MILGAGIDIIEIERIRRVVNRRRNFTSRFFTPGERKYFHSRGKKSVESIAGYFAAKEAVVKSIGTGFSGFRWQEIEIKKLAQGQPQVILWGKAKTEAKKRGISRIVLSISHCKEYAVAQAIAIREKK